MLLFLQYSELVAYIVLFMNHDAGPVKGLSKIDKIRMAAEKLLVGSFKLISQAALPQMLLLPNPPDDVNRS
jgi:hypothetical protein